MNSIVGCATEYGELGYIWIDSLKLCKASLGQIAYDDFKRLMKGQPKDSASSSSRSHTLQCVPEGKNNVTGLQPDQEAPKREKYSKRRAHSLIQLNNAWEDDERSLDQDASRALNITGSMDSLDWEQNELAKGSSPSPLLANKALYRKHRGMRLAVLEATKHFNQKRNEKTSLIMRRGSQAPVDLENAKTRAQFDATAKRCGRARRNRNKTVSDVTGMLLDTN